MAVRGTTNFVLARKLKEVKERLNLWNKDCFWRLEYNKNQALSEVEACDKAEEERILSLEECVTTTWVELTLKS